MELKIDLSTSDYSKLKAHVVSGGEIMLSFAVPMEGKSEPEAMALVVPSQNIKLERYASGVKVILLVPFGNGAH